MAGGFQILTDARGASALPNNGIVQSLSRLGVPQHRRLALIRNANGHDVAGLISAIGKDRRYAFENRLPNTFGIVLNPAWLRKNLRKLMVHRGHEVACCVHECDRRAGGALINC